MEVWEGFFKTSFHLVIPWKKLMIPTSRNVSTFFLTLSHTHSGNVHCQSWMLQQEHAVRRNAPNVPAGGKHGPSVSWAQGPSDSHSAHTDKGPPNGLWEGWGSAGRQSHLPLAIKLQTLVPVSSGEEEREQSAWSHFPWLSTPKLFSPG